MLIKAALFPLLALPLFASCVSPSTPDVLSGLAADTGHELYRVRGWPVLMESEWVSEEPEFAAAVRTHLDAQFYIVERAVGLDQLAVLKKVVVWVEGSDPAQLLGGMCYHPDGGWLETHGYDARRALGVEISDPEGFLTITRTQPWVMMHELAHAYHHQVLGFDDPAVVELYEAAVLSGDYDETFRLHGRPDRHYALTNPMEYFAEGTEAYLGTNDFYPFVRGELIRHDPLLAELLSEVWGD
jgi:hypothetical protein